MADYKSLVDAAVDAPRGSKAVKDTKDTPKAVFVIQPYQHPSFESVAAKVATGFTTEQQVLGALILANQERTDQHKRPIENLVEIAARVVSERGLETNHKIQAWIDEFHNRGTRNEIDARHTQSALKASAPAQEAKVA